jgi:hypothetical protein
MPFPSKPPSSTPTSSDLIVGSASVGGTMIAVAATSSPGTTLHTVPVSGLEYQRIKVWAVNIDTVERTLTVQFGGTATKDSIIVKLGPQRGLSLVVPDLKLQKGLIVKAFASVTNTVNVYVGVGERDKNP